MNEVNNVNTNRMNTATSMQSQHQQFMKNNVINNPNLSGHGYSPYGGCCYGGGYNNGGSEVGAALGGMAVGAMMASLPRQAAPVYAPGPTPYYYSDGTFMVPVQSGGYQVMPPPIGAMVTSVPPGAYETTLNGTSVLCFRGDIL